MYRSALGRWLTATAAIAVAAVILPCVIAVAETDAELYRAAGLKHKARDLPAAEKLYSQLIEQYPSSPQVPGALLSVAYIRMNTPGLPPDNVVNAFSEVRRRFPKSPEAGEALAKIGYLHLRSDAPQALKDFETFMKEYSGHKLGPEIQLAIARIHYRAKEWDKAQAAFDRVKDVPEASLEQREEAALAGALVNTERFLQDSKMSHLDKAIEALTKLVPAKTLRVSASAELGIAEALLYQGRYPEALEKYKAAAEKYSAETYYRVLALYGAACCCQGSADPEGAMKYFKTCLEAVPGRSAVEKDAAWKSAAIATKPLHVRRKLKKAQTPFHGDTILCQALWGYASALHSLKRDEEAVAAARDLLTCVKPDTALAVSAGILIENCEKGNGGSKQ